MAEFTASVAQNEYLPDGGTDVHAIVTIECSGAGQTDTTGHAGEIIIIDTSGSMGRVQMEEAKAGAIAAISEIPDGTYFAIISGNGAAFLAYPNVRSGPGMVKMDPTTRDQGIRAVSGLSAAGGTVISTWLDLAGTLFQSVPEVTQRHAILLTDGENNEPPHVLDQAISRADGLYQCDCRGVGTDWKPSEIRRIAQGLLGTLGFIEHPEALREEFRTMMRSAMSRGVADAQMRIWTPQGSQVLFVRQVNPQVDELTHRRTAGDDLNGDYPTGAWSDETREYHVAVRLAARAVGQEQLAARVRIVVGGQEVAPALIKAKWSNDDALTTKINGSVAHYTGQTELAQAIQEGLEAKAVGNEELATTKLGRAVQLAAQTGNEEATSKLRRVVDVDNEEQGTVRLKRTVDKAAEIDLDTASTKTTRVRK